MNNDLDTRTHQHARAAWAERQAASAGSIKRADIVNAFGVSEATATSDLAYLTANHDCLEYHHASRSYQWKGGKRIKLAPPPWINLFTV